MTRSISSLSTIHKILLSLSLASVIFGLFLHNPISGYEIEIPNPSNLSGTAKVPCSESEKASYRADFEQIRKSGLKIADDPTKDQEYIDSSVAACTHSLPLTIIAPISEWKTTSPMIIWFGSVLNVFQYSLLITSICFSVGFIFSPRRCD